MQSASPDWISLAATARAWPPVAHADERLNPGPFAWILLAHSAGPTLVMNMGTVMGDILRAPRVKNTFICSSMVAIPPAPEPMRTPIRKGS